MRHHSTSIVGPDIDGEVTKEGMIAAMEDASKLVASWPEWKREVLREPDSAQPSMKEAMARVDARAEKIVAGIPLGQRAIVSKDELRPAQPSVGERHKPLNMPAGRSKMIEKAINADDGACSTGKFAESDEAEYWSLRTALATIAHENLNTIGLSDSEKVAAFKKLAIDALSAALASRVKRAEREGKR